MNGDDVNLEDHNYIKFFFALSSFDFLELLSYIKWY